MAALLFGEFLYGELQLYVFADVFGSSSSFIRQVIGYSNIENLMVSYLSRKQLGSTDNPPVSQLLNRNPWKKT